MRLTDYHRSSIDLSDYADLRASLLRMSSRKKVLPKTEPKEPLLAMMSKISKQLQQTSSGQGQLPRKALTWTPKMGL